MISVITCGEAKKLGLKRYFTGKPCKHGHVSERHVINRACYECVMISETRKAWRIEYSAIPEVKARKKAYIKEYWLRVRPTLSEEKRERQRATCRKWRQNNLEHARELDRKCSERNKERRHAYGKEYLRKYPEKAAAKERNKRARIRQNGGTHTADDVASIKRLQKNKCAYCKKSVKIKYHVDHIIPIVKDGRNDRTNLQILCGPCNHRKHSKDPMIFARSLGMLL